MYKLIIEDDEGKTTVVPLIRDEITIGRKDGNTIRLTERNVSRRHAKLSKQTGAILIEDLQSHNGIKVNGDRISGKASLKEGDRVQIGDYQISIKLDKTQGDDGNDKTTPFVREEHGAILEAAAASSGVSESAPEPAPTPREVPPGRLVIVSSNFAGKEYLLDRPSTVVGRTDDNDIVVNHRSISRHHAKFTRGEDGKYSVEDQGSQNGVRVNGEQFTKTELRRGDHVDLGHVRFRFVAGGEDFVFSRDAQIIDVDAAVGGRGKGLLIAGVLAALIAAGAIGAIVMTRRGGEDPAVGSARLSVEIQQSLKSLDWDGAIAKAGEALKADPQNESIRQMKSKAEQEKRAQAAYDDYQRAANANDFDSAVAKYQAIGESSVYRERADQSWGKVKAGFVGTHLDAAKGLAGQNKCDEAKAHVEKVFEIDDANADALSIAQKCGQPPPKPKRVVTAAPEGSPSPSPEAPPHHAAAPEPEEPAAPAPAPKPVVKPAAPGGGDLNDLLMQAQDDYVHNNYSDAISKAKSVLAQDGGNAKAQRIIGASSCFLHDKNAAVASWNKLGAMDRQFLKYVCQRNNITIP